MSIMSNIHKIASRVIGMQSIEYRKSLSVSISECGIERPSYGEWIRVRAHVQPGIVASFGSKNLSEKDYKEMGLDWSSITKTVWLSDQDIHTIAIRPSTDQFRINGKIYNIIQMADWDEFNGWRRCYCQQVINNHV